MTSAENRTIIEAINSHFKRQAEDAGVLLFLDGQVPVPKPSQYLELRLAECTETQLGATTREIWLSVNILMTTPSGLDLKNPVDPMATEDLLGTATEFFKAFSIPEFGCFTLQTVNGKDLSINRPRQIESNNVRRGDITGHYKITLSTI